MTAIADTFERWQERLGQYCAKLLHDRHDAEEVVQDVFTRLCSTPGRYDLAEQAEVLLFRMAHNACIDRRRKHRATSNSTVEPESRDPERNEELEAALALLPAAERETLLLTTVDGLGYREVAAILGCSLGTVAARRGAAIRNLRKRLT